jgi:hypothetical protein
LHTGYWFDICVNI